MAYINAGIPCPVCREEYAFEFDTSEFENMDGWMCVDVQCKECDSIVTISTWIDFDIDEIVEDKLNGEDNG